MRKEKSVFIIIIVAVIVIIMWATRQLGNINWANDRTTEPES